MKQRRALVTCGFSAITVCSVATAASRRTWIGCSTARPGRGRRFRVSLSRSPFLRHLRSQRRAGVVRRLPRCYATVRIPARMHVRLVAIGLPRPAHWIISGRRWQDLPVPVQGVSTHTQGLRLRGTWTRACRVALPSIAFCFGEQHRRPGLWDFAAQWLSCVCPCQRFVGALTSDGA